MTTDPIAAAIDHIRSITPADNPWTADDVSSFSPWEPDESDYAIATILNAVVSGQLINRASRDEMLAQVRRGEGFATAGAEASWISDSEAGVYDTDAPDPIAAARALIEPLTGYTPGPWRDWKTGYVSGPEQGEDGDFDLADVRLIAAAPDLRDMVATLADALKAERARAEKAESERDALAAVAYEDAALLSEVQRREGVENSFYNDGWYACATVVADTIRALTPAAAKAALDKLLAEARLEGWRAGRDAAAGEAMRAAEGWFIEFEAADLANNVELSAYYGNRQTAAEWITAAISALPEPKEASHD